MKQITTKERVLRAALIAALSGTMGAMALPVSAEGSDTDVTKDESVYIVLNADGSTKDVTVSDQLHSDSGFKNYTDKSSLNDVENLKSTDPIQSTNGGYVWNTDQKDIFYQGKGSENLPLDVSISYQLDGKKVKAEDMAGKSGHMRMTLHVDNRKSKTYTVNGRSYTIAMPFITLAGAMMDGQKFTNVKISSGTVSSDSSHQIAAAVMLPGMRDSLDGIIDASLMRNLDSYLSDEITIEADVDDFESPNVMLAASTNIEDLKDEMKDIDNVNADDLVSDLDKLDEATEKLVSGTKSLYDGAVSASDGGTALSNGASQLSDGAAALVDGANKLSTGASKLSSGASDLETGLGTLSSNSEALNKAANLIAQGILDTANKTLDQNEATKDLPDLTMTNYADVIGKFTGDANMRSVTLKQIEKQAGVDEATVRALIYMAGKDDPNKTDWNQADLAIALSAEGKKATAAQEVQKATASYNSKEDALNDTAVQKVLEGVRAQKLANIDVPEASDEQMDQVYSTIASKVLPVLKAKLANTPYASLANETTANAIVTSALHAMASQGIEINEADLTKTLMASAGSLDASSISAAIKAYGEYQKDPYYAAFAKGAYEKAYKEQYTETLKNMSQSDLYDQVTSQIKATPVGKNLDDASMAKLIAYTADHYDAAKDLSTQLRENGAVMLSALQVGADMQESATENGQTSVNGILDMLYKGNDSYKDLKSLENSLTGVKTFIDSLKMYTNGVDTAYTGSKALKDGADQLADGASQLNDGVSKLNDGASKLSAGASTLATGLNKLKDGAKDLMDGMQKYDEEGISKLTKNNKIKDMQNAADLLEDVRTDGESYNNYSGISEGTDGEVKFVYKVDSVAQKTKEETKDDTADVEEEDHTTFWQRVLALFSFKK